MFNEVEVFDVLTKREIKALQDYINCEMQNLKQSSGTKVKYSISMFYIEKMQIVKSLENALMAGRDVANATFYELTRIYNDAMERLSLEVFPFY